VFAVCAFKGLLCGDGCRYAHAKDDETREEGYYWKGIRKLKSTGMTKKPTTWVSMKGPRSTMTMVYQKEASDPMQGIPSAMLDSKDDGDLD